MTIVDGILVLPTIGKEVIDVDLSLTNPDQNVAQIQVGIYIESLARVDQSGMNTCCL